MRWLPHQLSSTTAIQLGETSISYLQLQKLVDEQIIQLEKLPQALLVLEATSDIKFIVQLLAALHMGKPIALFSPTLTEEEKQLRLQILGNAITVTAQGELLAHYDHPTLQHHPQLALVLFTSGTTGQIKAVQLSQHNIHSNCKAVIKALQFSKIQKQLLFLPLSYSFGLLGQLLPGLMTGITTQLITHFTDIKELLEQGAVPQMWSGVPSHWVAISKIATLYPQNVAAITAIVSAGAPLSVGLRAELKQRFPNAILYNNYGLTEASPRVLTYSSEDPLFMEAYAGYPIGDWKIKRSDEGELLIQGSQTMLGYLGDEQNSKIQNGWLATGDMVEILPTGLVAIKGRRDNIVNIGGEKIHLADIEQKLCRIEGIKEILLVPLVDDIYGTRLVACLEQHTLQVHSTEQQVAEHIHLHLLPQKLPITVRFVDRLPRNQHGKLDRNHLLLKLSLEQKENNDVKR